MLVGRTVELARIDGLLACLGAGRSDALALVGEPGIGKSALLAEAVRRADRCRVVQLQGVAAEVALPFAGLRHLLGPLLADGGNLDTEVRQSLDAAFGRRAPHADTTAEVAAATMSLLAHSAERGPVLVVIDDLHWVDEPSASALLLAARRLLAEPVGLLVASRHRNQVRAFAIDQLDVVGLGETDVRSLLGERVDGAVARQLRDASAGNPLAVIEMAAALTAAERTGRAAIPAQLPQTTVEDLFVDRLVSLDDRSRRAAAVAAAGGNTPPAVLEAALDHCGLSLDDLAPVFDLGLLTGGDGPLRWRHPLAHSAAWRSAHPHWRRSAHGGLAAAWQRAGQDGAGPAVWHRAATALPGDEAVAVDLAGHAATASARCAYATAADWWHAAARLGRVAQRPNRLTEAARAAEAAGQLGRARQLWTDLLALNVEDQTRAIALRALGRAEFEDGTASLALAYFVEAAALDCDLTTRLFSLSEGVFASMYVKDHSSALDLAALADRLADHGDPLHEFLSLHASGAARCLAGDFALGRPELDKAIALALEQGLLEAHPELALWVVSAPLLARVDSPIPPKLLAAVELMRRRRDLTWLPRVIRLLGYRHRRAGQVLTAYALFEEAAELALEAGQGTQLTEAVGALARVEAARGETESALAHARQARVLADRHSVPWLAPDSWWCEGLVRLAERDPVAARAPMAQAVALAPDAVDLLADYVEVLVNVGDHAAATNVVEQSSALHVSAEPAAFRARALIAGDDAAWPLFDRACEAQDVFESARSHLLYGERLRRAGRRRDARRELTHAAMSFDRIGARPWADRARAELAASGLAVPRSEVRFGDLTAAELRVASLVAGGMRTREVASLLFLSPKTVEFHLTIIYRKLGITNRAALAASAAGILAR